MAVKPLILSSDRRSRVSMKSDLSKDLLAIVGLCSEGSSTGSPRTDLPALGVHGFSFRGRTGMTEKESAFSLGRSIPTPRCYTHPLSLETYDDCTDLALVIDAHCHILPPSFRDRRAEIAQRDATFAALLSDPAAAIASAEDLLSAMDRGGVDRAVVMGMGWTDPDVAMEANDYIIQAVAENPSRLTGFCSVNPVWGERAFSEAKRCFAAGLAGIGELHADTQGFDITSVETMAPIMELARSDGRPVLVHASEPVGHGYPGKGSTTPDKLYRFIQNFPGNPIICAHWGGGLPFYSLMPEVKESLKNVYFDSAASPFLYRPEVFATVSELVGKGKVFFASDYPLLDISRPLEQARTAGLAPDVEAALLSGNAAKLFGL